MAKRSFFGKVRDFFLGPKTTPTPPPKPKPVPKPAPKPLPTTRPVRVRVSDQEKAEIARRRQRAIKAEQNKSKLVDHIQDLFGDTVDDFGNIRFNRSTVRSEVHRFDDAFVQQLLNENDPDEILDLVYEYKAEHKETYAKPNPLFYH